MIRYKIGLCNPDKRFAKQLIHHMNLYAKKHHISFDIKQFHSHDDLLIEYRHHTFHMLFLSLGQENIHGMMIAKALRKLDNHIPIVFTATDGHHALEAFEVYASGYLINSFTKKQMHTILKKSLTLITLYTKQEQIRKRLVSIQTSGGFIQLQYKDILYISKSKNKVIFYTKFGEFQVYTTLKEVMKSFQNRDFHYINQSQIINQTHIESANQTYITIGSTQLKTSRRNICKINRLLEQDWQKALDEK